MVRSAKDWLAVARDITGITGLGSITWGAYQIYHPAGFIVGGLFAAIVSVLLSFADRDKKAVG